MTTLLDLYNKMSEEDRALLREYYDLSSTLSRGVFLDKALKPLFEHDCRCKEMSIYFTWTCPIHGTMTPDEVREIAEFQGVEYTEPEHPYEDKPTVKALFDLSTKMLDL